MQKIVTMALALMFCLLATTALADELTGEQVGSSNIEVTGSHGGDSLKGP